MPTAKNKGFEIKGLYSAAVPSEFFANLVGFARRESIFREWERKGDHLDCKILLPQTLLFKWKAEGEPVF